MARIRMKIFIHNDSDAKLLFAGGELLNGSYTSGWHPPPVIEAGTTKGFQGEGELLLVPTIGTEGRVRYTIEGEPGEIYIHWNSPVWESQYANTFHIYGPSNWNVSYIGGQGGDAKLEIRVRRSVRQSVPNFHPKMHGLSFPNSWREELPVMSVGFLWNELVKSLPGPLGVLGIGKVVPEDFLSFTNTSHGMCGGMVFAVMDYFHHNLLPPNQRTSPIDVNDPLFLYIRERLWDSFDVAGHGHRFLAYSSPHYPNGDKGVIQDIFGLAKGRSWVTYREEWPRIQADIDAGRLSPIGLIQTDNLNIGINHQVLAYAYKKDGQSVTLFIYDPNEPQEEVALKFNISLTHEEVHISRFINEREKPPTHRIFAFFKIDGYQPKKPSTEKNTAYYTNSGSIATVSRIPGSMETWWITSNGAVKGANWYEDSGWKHYELAPPGSASPNGSITAISRVPHSMEVWWIGADGSVQDAYWYEGDDWKRFQLAPPKSANPKGGITAVSRRSNTMEVWWIGENGSVQDANWYEVVGWQRYELAPPGSASLNAGIIAVSRISNSLEIWWIGANGVVCGAFWYEGSKEFQRYELSAIGNASVNGGITAVSRIPDSMEVWWIGNNGSIQAAYWYEGEHWKHYELAPPTSAEQGGNLVSISKDPKTMQVWWIGSDGLIKTKARKEDISYSWRNDYVNSLKKASPDGGISVVSRIINSQEIFWINIYDSVEGAYQYYPMSIWKQYKLAESMKEKVTSRIDEVDINQKIKLVDSEKSSTNTGTSKVKSDINSNLRDKIFTPINSNKLNTKRDIKPK
ncbi:hypothetical protein L1279_000560 [Planomicrobium sp. HSC-17F08]|nr:hypothetical protein [Planomicrobium sp. HSC-17F08]